MSDTIALTGVRAFGYHGVLEHEKRDGQEFIVDVVIETSFDQAIRSDDVAATVDYAQVAELIETVVSTTRFDLIESLVHELCLQIKAMPRVNCVRCTVHKPHAPIQVPFTDVSVSMEMR
jgi:dihydroneopterin aldolase